MRFARDAVWPMLFGLVTIALVVTLVTGERTMQSARQDDRWDFEGRLGTYQQAMLTQYDARIEKLEKELAEERQRRIEAEERCP